MRIVPEQKRSVQVGQKFGCLRIAGVEFYAQLYQRKDRYVVGTCDCGGVMCAASWDLRSGKIVSCGCREKNCKNNLTHGGSSPDSPEEIKRLHRIWKGMRGRCLSPKNGGYPNYGGRGIRVCEAWDSFENFRDWSLGAGYVVGLSVDRIDPNGNYEPSNCRWVTPLAQASNRRNCVVIEAFGEKKILAHWAADPRCNVTRSTIMKRLREGMLPELAMTAMVLLSMAGFANSQLIPEEKLARIRQIVPQFASEEIDTVAHDESALWYDEQSMPKAYQFNGTAHSPAYNIAANPDPHGSANAEFPWAEAAGTDNAENLEAVRFVWLPSVDGRRLPIVYYRQRLATKFSDEPPSVAWTFPRGTVVGELFTIRSPSGKDFAFEVRTRTKFADGWRMEVYRPYPTSYSLARRLRELGEVSLATQVAKPLAGSLVSMRNPHPKRVVSEEANWQALPKMPAELVEKLLHNATFHECSHTAWNYAGDKEQHAPAVRNDDTFNIVPAGYTGAVVPVTDNSCVRCHETTLKHAEEFAPNIGRAAFSVADTHREWYGRVRGSDAIFSFHPFEPSCISGNGGAIPVRYRQALLTAGIIAPYDSKKHPAERYRRGT